MKNQEVLSINQVQELRHLGLNVAKFSSVHFMPSMNVGDIIDILPAKINYHGANFELMINKDSVKYYSYLLNDCIFEVVKEKLIDSLYKVLIWCITNNHLNELLDESMISKNH